MHLDLARTILGSEVSRALGTAAAHSTSLVSLRSIHTRLRNMHIYLHTYLHTCMRACVHACMHACMHAYIHTYIHTYTHTYTHTHIHTHTHTHTRIHTYTHTHTHTRTHTHTVCQDADRWIARPCASSCPLHTASTPSTSPALMSKILARMPWGTYVSFPAMLGL